MLTIPIPTAGPGLLRELHSFHDVDSRIGKLLKLKESEWVLVEDLLRYAVPDLHDPQRSEARLPTSDGHAAPLSPQSETHLLAYCDYFARVLRAGFGSDKNVVARIFQQPQGETLPVRLVALHLTWPKRSEPIIEPMDSQALIDRLLQLDKKLLRANKGRRGGVFYQRIARIYDSYDNHGTSIPTVYIVKPDERRYWTRSMAMRDADAVAADIMLVDAGEKSRVDKKSRRAIG
jgi:hypothetical protein